MLDILSLKRGVDLECLYFESPPHTSIEAKNKVIKLASIIDEYSGNIYPAVITVYATFWKCLRSIRFDGIDHTYRTSDRAIAI